MTNWLLAAHLVVNGLILGLLIYAGLRFRFVVKEFITPQHDNEASPAGIILANLGQQFAKQIVEQAKVTLMGYQSGLLRAEKAVKGDIVQGVLSSFASKSPLVSALLTIVPGLNKTARKYPDQTLGILSQLIPGGNNGEKPPEVDHFGFES